MRGIKKKIYQITVHDHAVLNKQYTYFGASIYDTVCSLNRKLNSSHRNITITLTVRDPSEACRISDFQCCYFLCSLSSSGAGFGSYLTFRNSLLFKQSQQNIVNYSETMVSRKLHDRNISKDNYYSILSLYI